MMELDMKLSSLLDKFPISSQYQQNLAMAFLVNYGPELLQLSKPVRLVPDILMAKGKQIVEDLTQNPSDREYADCHLLGLMDLCRSIGYGLGIKKDTFLDYQNKDRALWIPWNCLNKVDYYRKFMIGLEDKLRIRRIFSDKFDLNSVTAQELFTYLESRFKRGYVLSGEYPVNKMIDEIEADIYTGFCGKLGMFQRLLLHAYNIPNLNLFIVVNKSSYWHTETLVYCSEGYKMISKRPNYIGSKKFIEDNGGIRLLALQIGPIRFIDNFGQTQEGIIKNCVSISKSSCMIDLIEHFEQIFETGVITSEMIEEKLSNRS